MRTFGKILVMGGLLLLFGTLLFVGYECGIHHAIVNAKPQVMENGQISIAIDGELYIYN